MVMPPKRLVLRTVLATGSVDIGFCWDKHTWQWHVYGRDYRYFGWVGSPPDVTMLYNYGQVAHIHGLDIMWLNVVAAP